MFSITCAISSKVLKQQELHHDLNPRVLNSLQRGSFQAVHIIGLIVTVVQTKNLRPENTCFGQNLARRSIPSASCNSAGDRLPPTNFQRTARPVPTDRRAVETTPNLSAYPKDASPQDYESLVVDCTFVTSAGRAGQAGSLSRDGFTQSGIALRPVLARTNTISGMRRRMPLRQGRFTRLAVILASEARFWHPRDA